MRVISAIIFLFLFNFSYSQNTLSTYNSAIEIIKSSTEFDVFLSEYNTKERNFSVSEITFPICVFFQTFKDYINPCKSTNWLEIWPKEKVENLESLGNRKNKKIKLDFTNTENNYFVAELNIKSQKRSLFFLFQINNDKLVLISARTTTVNN